MRKWQIIGAVCGILNYLIWPILLEIVQLLSLLIVSLVHSYDFFQGYHDDRLKSNSKCIFL